jgi:hypothetical protein
VLADVQELARVIQKRERDEAADWKELKERLRAAAEMKTAAGRTSFVVCFELTNQ